MLYVTKQRKTRKEREGERESKETIREERRNGERLEALQWSSNAHSPKRLTKDSLLKGPSPSQYCHSRLFVVFGGEHSSKPGSNLNVFSF